ncbi:AbiV family abortive infection protein [Methyloceanibacter sp. wino2]|uniref:AbiV family abortive infection protein n=1 Tax=Methyloceanibacter sp. wino2 TaxID=2170729 RepID=UPI00131EF620|nr:AbiV family abortive infection protein [Methyloceanibacter sp. wino2]
MTSERDDQLNFIREIEAAIAFGGPAHGTSATELFDRVAKHVNGLLIDAKEAFGRRSFGTSVFLAISAMEETAKAEVLAFRTLKSADGRGQGRDPMRDHASKHRLAVRRTAFMGRLPDLLGAENCARLQRDANTGQLVRLRERALYAHIDETGVSTPAMAISESQARELLPLATEVADDVLVGWTNQSYVLGESFERLFSELAGHIEP